MPPNSSERSNYLYESIGAIKAHLEQLTASLGDHRDASRSSHAELRTQITHITDELSDIIPRLTKLESEVDTVKTNVTTMAPHVETLMGVRNKLVAWGATATGALAIAGYLFGGAAVPHFFQGVAAWVTSKFQ